jgi:hypothetical protein
MKTFFLILREFYSFPTKEDAAKWTGSVYPTLNVFRPFADLRFLSLKCARIYGKNVETHFLYNLYRNGIVILGFWIEICDILVGKLISREDEPFSRAQIIRDCA